MVPEQDSAKPLHLDQDLTFQRRSWTIQRLGWSAMGVTILAALLGLFGTGPLSSATVSSQDGALILQYNRFWRIESSMTLRLSVAPDAGSAHEARVGLSQAYLDGVRVQDVTPPPQRVEVAPEYIIYVFSLAAMHQPIRITFTVEPQRPGRLSGRFRVHNNISLHFAQFIYP
jgi:hypothetical protein